MEDRGSNSTLRSGFTSVPNGVAHSSRFQLGGRGCVSGSSAALGCPSSGIGQNCLLSARLSRREESHYGYTCLEHIEAQLY